MLKGVVGSKKPSAIF